MTFGQRSKHRLEFRLGCLEKGQMFSDSSYWGTGMESQECKTACLFTHHVLCKSPLYYLVQPFGNGLVAIVSGASGVLQAPGYMLA